MPISASRSQASRPSSTRSSTAASSARASTRAAQVGHASASSYDRGASRLAQRGTAASNARARFTSQGRTAQRTAVGSNTGTVRRGDRNETVRALQERLNASGFDVGRADGSFGPRTERAVRDYQRSVGLCSDGVVGRRTFSTLNGASPTRRATTPAAGATGTAAAGVARMNGVPSGRGLATGKVTVNGHTYDFNSGSSRLYSTPTGTYRVTAHRNSRSDAGFTRNGVGFSFQMEDPRRPGSDRFYDPRAGRDRSALRIHPDGGARGTAGCLGIVGDAATLRQFRDDMNAELRRNGGTYTLRVQ